MSCALQPRFHADEGVAQQNPFFADHLSLFDCTTQRALLRRYWSNKIHHQTFLSSLVERNPDFPVSATAHSKSTRRLRLSIGEEKRELPPLTNYCGTINMRKNKFIYFLDSSPVVLGASLFVFFTWLISARCIHWNNAPQMKFCPALGLIEILFKSAHHKWTKLIGN